MNWSWSVRGQTVVGVSEVPPGSQFELVWGPASFPRGGPRYAVLRVLALRAYVQPLSIIRPTLATLRIFAPVTGQLAHYLPLGVYEIDAATGNPDQTFTVFDSITALNSRRTALPEGLLLFPDPVLGSRILVDFSTPFAGSSTEGMTLVGELL